MDVRLSAAEEVKVGEKQSCGGRKRAMVSGALKILPLVPTIRHVFVISLETQ